jgi:hypothetical protein
VYFRSQKDAPQGKGFIILLPVERKRDVKFGNWMSDFGFLID